MNDVCCISGGYTVDARVTVQPSDTVALAGTRVQLQCTTDQLVGSAARITWLRNEDPIVGLNCELNPSFPQYSVVSTSPGQCDLVINNASLELAASYSCNDLRDSPEVSLTVVGKLCVKFT